MEKITEQQHIEKQWYKDAKEQTLETLPSFINHVMNGYEHDYGTICHAIAACALAATYAANEQPQGGITGFQAGYVMTQYMKNWMYSDLKTTLRIVDFDKMLYPQYQDYFDKLISKETFDSIQEEARRRIAEVEEERKALKNLGKDANSVLINPDVLKHWKSIAEGNVPFGYKLRKD